MEAPKQMDMDAEHKLLEIFESHQALLVKQTMRGCLQECLGCDAKSEYKVAPLDEMQIDGFNISEEAMNVPDIMYALEESNCCCRTFNAAGRNFQMNVSQGGEPGGEKILSYDKPLTCPATSVVPLGKNGEMDCPCCCCLPNVTPMTPQGQPMNSQSRYQCDEYCFVPKFTYHEEGQLIYTVKPETCCFGCCVACDCCTGNGLLFMPFYFHDEKGEMIGGTIENSHTPQIRYLWAGWKRECCSTADNFSVVFPENCSNQRKAGLLGLTFLIDFVLFEGHQGQGN